MPLLDLAWTRGLARSIFTRLLFGGFARCSPLDEGSAKYGCGWLRLNQSMVGQCRSPRGGARIQVRAPDTALLSAKTKSMTRAIPAGPKAARSDANQVKATCAVA